MSMSMSMSMSMGSGGFTGNTRAPWEGGDAPETGIPAPAATQAPADPPGLLLDVARAQIALRLPCQACNRAGAEDSYEGGAWCSVCNPENSLVEHGYPQGWIHVFVPLTSVLEAWSRTNESEHEQ